MQLARRVLTALLRPKRCHFLFAALLCGGVLRLVVAGFTSDDAYISLTYARNLAKGSGLVFNPGEPIYGFTNSGWTVIISLFFRALPEQHAIVGIKLLALAASLSTMALLYHMTRKQTGAEIAARLLTVLWVLQPWDVAEAMNGLETPMYGLLLLASLYMCLETRWWLMGCGLGVATLMRPEASTLFVLVMVHRFVEHKARALADLARGMAAFGLAVLPWYLYSGNVYGTWLPNSFFEKLNPTLVSPRHILSQLILVVVSYLPLCLAVVWRLDSAGRNLHEHKVVNVFFIWAAGMMGYYLMIPAFVRYFVGPSLIILFCFAKPLNQWVHGLEAVSPGKFQPFQFVMTLVVGYSVLWGASGSLANLYFYKRSSEGFRDIHVYTAKWIAENTAPSAIVATHDVGAMGFYSKRYILDTTGLVSGRDQSVFSSPQEWLKNKKPDYLFISLDWAGTLPYTLDCKLSPILTRRGRISFRTPAATFVLYNCEW